jgi:lipopolysaccharide/colanic/teichoic acid biosynthesis glycosyltransferase
VKPKAIASPSPRLGPAARRAIDICVLVLVAPVVLALLALLALAVKLDSPGPVLISVRRVGKGGRVFRLLKLRTMVKDAEEKKKQLAHLNVLPWPDFKIPNDPRVTRVGRWLRKTSLDELPQLWNVLRGEMTLVGPRACSVGIDKYSLWQTERLEVTPGLMGRWQADGRNQADFAGRCRMDIAQLRSQSPATSIVLAARTVRAVLTSRESY